MQSKMTAKSYPQNFQTQESALWSDTLVLDLPVILDSTVDKYLKNSKEKEFLFLYNSTYYSLLTYSWMKSSLKLGVISNSSSDFIFLDIKVVYFNILMGLLKVLLFFWFFDYSQSHVLTTPINYIFTVYNLWPIFCSVREQWWGECSHHRGKHHCVQRCSPCCRSTARICL